MKPEGPVARREDYRVVSIAHAEGATLIRQYHYARGCSNTGIMHGLFHNEQGLVGVAHWLPPTRVCAESVSPHWQRVLSLTRLVVLPEQPQNCATMLLGASVRLLRAMKRYAALVTYADEAQGHTGTIYKASGWEYIGRTGPYPRWLTADGAQVATKSGPKTRTKAEMLALGHVMVGRFYKHKFVKQLP